MWYWTWPQDTFRHVKRQFIFTQTWFEPKKIYSKKCVNYKKSNLQQKSVQGPEVPNSAKNAKKINRKFPNVPKKMPTKSVKSRHYSFSWQNSVKCCKDNTRDRIFVFTNIVGTLVPFLNLWTYYHNMFRLFKRFNAMHFS